MANSSLVLSQSRLVARSLDQKLGAKSASSFAVAAFERVLGRLPSSQERQACEQFLDEQSRLLANPKALTTFAGNAADVIPPSPNPQMRARENLVHVLFNHSDFVTIR